MKILMYLLIIFAFIQTPSAHEGHDHGAPSFQAPKGGLLKSIESSHFELIRSGQNIQIYVYDDQGKALPTNKFKTNAQLELPRQKKAPLAMTDKGTHWEASVDAKGAHRFTVRFNVDDGKEKDYVSFTVETK